MALFLIFGVKINQKKYIYVDSGIVLAGNKKL